MNFKNEEITLLTDYITINWEKARKPSKNPENIQSFGIQWSRILIQKSIAVKHKPYRKYNGKGLNKDKIPRNM